MADPAQRRQDVRPLRIAIAGNTFRDPAAPPRTADEGAKQPDPAQRRRDAADEAELERWWALREQRRKTLASAPTVLPPWVGVPDITDPRDAAVEGWHAALAHGQERERLLILELRGLLALNDVAWGRYHALERHQGDGCVCERIWDMRDRLLTMVAAYDAARAGAGEHPG